MTNCDEIRSLLGSWYDGELELAERVDRHLAGCRDCTAHVDQWRRVDEHIGLELPESDLAGDVLEAIRRERSPAAPWWLRIAAAVIVSLALGSFAGVATSRASEGPPAPSNDDVTLQALEASFGPDAMAGIDHIAVQLSQGTQR